MAVKGAENQWIVEEALDKTGLIEQNTIFTLKEKDAKINQKSTNYVLMVINDFFKYVIYHITNFIKIIILKVFLNNIKRILAFHFS